MKKKILFVIESLTGGGAEKVLSVIVKYFDYNQYEVTVCPIVDVGVYCEEVKKNVTYYNPIISFKGNFLSRIWNSIKYKFIYTFLPLRLVYKWFVPKNNDIEVAFCEGYVTKLLACSGSESKKIAWVHTDLTDNPWPIEIGIYKDEKEEREAYKIYHKIVCVSKTVEKSFKKKYFLDKNTCTIYNPIDVDNIKKKAGVRVKTNNDVKQIISVGRLVPQKGYDRLLRVAKQLYEEGFVFHLKIIGEGDERSNLEKYIEKNSLESFVTLPGFSTNPYENLINSDLFVCSSLAEGFSLVIAEAIILGIPVISTCCSGPKELLSEWKNGLLVENTTESLYLGIKSFLINKNVIPNNNTTEFSENFRAENIMKELMNIL